MNKYFNNPRMIQLLFISLFILFVWNRLIRERLPRDIPFILNIWSFLILVYICLSSMYIIYFLIKPRTNSTLKSILAPFLQRLVILNNIIISNFYVSSALYFLLYKLKIILQIAANVRKGRKFFVYLFVNTLPKLMLLICFLIDSFYSKQLYLIYHCAIVITFPITIRYLLYCGKLLREKDIKELEKYFIIEITSEDIVYPKEDYDDDGMLNYDYYRQMHYEDPSMITYDSPVGSTKKYLQVKNFLYYQTNAVTWNRILYEYNILYQEERKDLYMFFFPEDYERYNATIAEITLKTHPITKKQCNNLLLCHIYSNSLENHISRAENQNGPHIKKINVILNFIFLCCWIYILVISVYNLQDDIFYRLISHYENPFQ